MKYSTGGAASAMKCRIRKIKPACAEIIVNARKPLGLFYLQSNVGDGEKGYVGIDNSAGHAWTEEFIDLHQCKQWLLNPSMLASFMENAA